METGFQKLAQRLPQSGTALFVCDIQERFTNLIFRFKSVVHSSKLMIPILATEQYPRGLGKLVQELELDASTDKILEKTRFSMVSDPVATWLNTHKIENVMLCGMETHVCVLQTAMDLKQLGISVNVLTDAVSSQREGDRSTALTRMQQMGLVMTTTESALFQMMEDAKHPRFKEVSTIIKEINDTRPDEDLCRL